MFKDVQVGLVGLVVSVLTAIALWFVEWETGFNFYGLSILFVIPGGAICTGFVAASGYWLGARLFNVRPSWRILVMMVFISVGCCALIHYLQYLSTELTVQGRVVRVPEWMSFGSFWQASVEGMTITFGSSSSAPEAGELGAWGYLFALFQVIGFALGGAVVYLLLAKTPWCEDCDLFLKRCSRIRRQSSFPAALQSKLQELEGATAGAWPEIVESFGEGEKIKGAMTEVLLEERLCPACERRWRKLEIHVIQKGSWTPLSRLEGFVAGELESASLDRGAVF